MQKGPKLKALFEEYGPTAIAVYLVLFALVFVGALVALRAGFKPTSPASASGLGLLAGAWVTAKVTQPVRIAITLVLTPVVARLWRRFRGRAT